MMPAATRPTLPRGLWPLTVAVLLAHLALLQGGLPRFEPNPGVRGKAFVTRTLASAAEPQPRPNAPDTPKASPKPSAQAESQRPAESSANNRSRGARVRPSVDLPMPQADAPDPVASPSPAHAEEPTGLAQENTSNQPAEPMEHRQVATNSVANKLPETTLPESTTTVARAANAATPATNAQPESNAVAPFAPPPSLRVQYNVHAQTRGIPFRAQGELRWQMQGGTYDARLEVSALFFGARVQTSNGRVAEGGLVPVRFADKVRAEQAAHFDFEAGRITFSNNAASAPLQPGAQDRLSVFVQLAGMFRADAGRYPEGSHIDVHTFGARGGGLWSFEVGGDDALELDGGTLTARKLVRQPSREYDQKIEVWLAPLLGHLPARIRITQANGDHVDQQWRTHSAQ